MPTHKHRDRRGHTHIHTATMTTHQWTRSLRSSLSHKRRAADKGTHRSAGAAVDRRRYPYHCCPPQPSPPIVLARLCRGACVYGWPANRHSVAFAQRSSLPACHVVDVCVPAPVCHAVHGMASMKPLSSLTGWSHLSWGRGVAYLPYLTSVYVSVCHVCQREETDGPTLQTDRQRWDGLGAPHSSFVIH